MELLVWVKPCGQKDRGNEGKKLPLLLLLQLWLSSTLLCRHPDPGGGSAGSFALSGRDRKGDKSRLIRSCWEGKGPVYHLVIKPIFLAESAYENQAVAIIFLARVLCLPVRDTVRLTFWREGSLWACVPTKLQGSRKDSPSSCRSNSNPSLWQWEP